MRQALAPPPPPPIQHTLTPRTQHAPPLRAAPADEHTPGTLTNASGTYKVDYAAYQARYGAVPPNGNSNLWYSYNHGAMHITNIDSEELQTPGSPQAQWLAADLAAVDRAVTPWLIMMQHRPVYSSTKSEAGDHTPGMGFPAKLEPYIKQYAVDLFLTGRALAPPTLCPFACSARSTSCPPPPPPPPASPASPADEHQYEATYPVFNGTVATRGDGKGVFTNPGAPIYVVQGTSGAFVSGDWETPQPAWSRYREGSSYGERFRRARSLGAASAPHVLWPGTPALSLPPPPPQPFSAGYGKMRVLGGSQLNYQWISIDGKVLDEFTINKA